MDLSFISWIDHAGFIIKHEHRNIYIDPTRIRKPGEHADVVFITHSHQDHLSVDDINKISDSNTVFIAPKEVSSKLQRKNIAFVEPDMDYEIAGIKFTTVPAYNIKKERLNFHPKANRWVGYIIKLNGMKVYHSGDTDLTEEIRKVSADVALIPAGGTYTMDVKDAIEAANSMRVKVVAPMHYKALLGEEGSKELEDKFKRNVKNSVILDQIQEPFYSF